MNQSNEIKHYVWNGPEIRAQIYGDAKLPDGANLHRVMMGHVSILPGDFIHLTHGASLGVSTRSGKGYISEFPHGKITLSGMDNCTVCEILNETQNNHYVQSSTSKEEYTAQLIKQKQRIEPQLNELREIYIFNEIEKRNKQKQVKEENERKSKERVNNAVEQMNAFFGKSKKP